MGMLKFSDGEEFDTSGRLRVELRADGWYVLGEGCLIPTNSAEDGMEVIQKLNEQRLESQAKLQHQY